MGLITAKESGCFKVELWDAVSPSTRQQLNCLLGKTVKATVIWIDTKGTVISKFNYDNVKLNGIEYPVMDYNKNSPCVIKAYFSYEKGTLEF